LSLLERHVENFNHGVRTGDWEPMLELLTEDADLEFTGIPVGPFHGRDAIADAYRTSPPDDEIVLLDRGPRYAWLGAPGQPAGELHLEERDGKIARLRVLYGQFSDQ
jgi:steroid Delta-isomerase